MSPLWTGQVQCDSGGHRDPVIQCLVSVLFRVGHISPGSSGVFLTVYVLGLHVLHRRGDQKVMARVFVCLCVCHHTGCQCHVRSNKPFKGTLSFGLLLLFALLESLTSSLYCPLFKLILAL